MLLDDVGSLIPGSTAYLVFKGALPDSTALSDRAVALFENGGDPQILNLKVDQASVQVIVRGPRLNQESSAYNEARQKTEVIYNTLHGLVNSTSSGNTVYGIVAEHAPIALGQDANQRPVFSMDFRVYRQSTST